MNATSTGARAALPKTRLERAWKGSSPRLTESSLRNWVEQARADRTKGRSELTTEEGAELAGLRKDNRELRMERDILKNVWSAPPLQGSASSDGEAVCVNVSDLLAESSDSSP